MPGWLQTRIHDLTDAASQAGTQFAFAIERYRQIAQENAKKSPTQANVDWANLMESYGGSANGVNVRPNDPFWTATDDRKKHHDTFVNFGKNLKITTHSYTDWNPLHAIAKIPVLGPVLKAAASPITMVANLAQGERIDHALLGAMKDQLGAIKSVAPYVAAVASFVPGIGTGVAAALSAGAALAEGKNITQAMEEGIKGAIPGGTIAAAGFDLAKKVASGANVAKATLETARASLPPAAQKAFDIGLAVTSAKSMQSSLNSAVANITPAETKQLLDVGAKAVQTTPGLADLAKSLPNDIARQGAQLAAGALAHQGVNEAQIQAMRSKLSGDQLHGFDTTLQSQVQHYPWLQGVVDAQSLAQLSPDQQKQLVDYAAAKSASAPVKAPTATPKPHEPQNQTRAPLPATPKPHEPPVHTRAPSLAPAQAPSVPASQPVAVPTGPAPAASTGPAPTTPATPSTDRPYPPYPQVGTLGFAPYPGVGAHPQHPQHPHSHPHAVRRGVHPSTTVVIAPAGGNCRQWSDPIEMDQAMIWAARSAVNGSKGQPRMVQGPDGTNYLFALENGVLTARQCLA